MKAQLLFPLAVVALFLSGCDSLSEAGADVRGKFAARDQPRMHVFNAEPRETYAAAVKALEGIGFRFTRGGPAQGRLEGVSGLVAGKSLAMTQQITLKATFEVAPEGGTSVGLHLYEVIENDADKSQGQGIASPMRDTPLYESFFREIQAQLAEAKKA
jgi:hypothetical protein